MICLEKLNVRVGEIDKKYQKPPESKSGKQKDFAQSRDRSNLGKKKTDRQVKKRARNVSRQKNMKTKKRKKFGRR